MNGYEHGWNSDIRKRAFIIRGGIFPFGPIPRDPPSPAESEDMM